MNDCAQTLKKTYSQLSPDPGLADRIEQALARRVRPARRGLGVLKPVLAAGLALLLVVSAGVLVSHLLGPQQVQPTQTAITTGAALWPALSLTEGVAMADHIVYGRVTAKRPLGSETLVTIAVIQVLKTSPSVPAELEEIPYYEIPPAADGTVYGIPPILADGQDVVLFLNRFSRVLSPDFVVPVRNGRAELTPFLKKHSVFADRDGNPAIEAFCDQVVCEQASGD